MAILLMNESHDMRHRFPQVDDGQRGPQKLGRHTACPPSSEEKEGTS